MYLITISEIDKPITFKVGRDDIRKIKKIEY